MIGKMRRVPLREVWKHEASDFTKWLQDNIDLLGETLDLRLSNPDREKPAGTFSVDLVTGDEVGNTVVIENQLEKSNHDHLGKLITYTVALEAKTAIWIVADARPEHVAAISWLNSSSSMDFYLLKVEAIRIEESPPAPLLTLIVGPNEESRAINLTKKELSDQQLLLQRFWGQLFELSNQKTSLFANRPPSRGSWLRSSAGKRVGFSYVIRKNDAQIQLDIEDEDRLIFAELEKSKVTVEDIFGEPLEWELSQGRGPSRIKKQIELGGYTDEAKWPEIQEAMVDAMVRLEKALKPEISKLKV